MRELRSEARTLGLGAELLLTVGSEMTIVSHIPSSVRWIAIARSTSVSLLWPTNRNAQDGSHQHNVVKPRHRLRGKQDETRKYIR